MRPDHANRSPMGSRRFDQDAATLPGIDDENGSASGEPEPTLTPADARDQAAPGPPIDVALGLADTTPGVPVSSGKGLGLPLAIQERYEHIEIVGEGGMGTVFRASDRRLGRRVALKFLRGSDPDLGRRFLQEARAQARLEHAHVCRVYEVGVADGRRYISMQYIEGVPLDRAKGRMTLEQKVKAIREVAAALHEAHRLGIIHRDVKPGNIMIERGEDGCLKPYIMDFGLAREVDDHGHTMTGVVMGTPAYMAPEQARGDIRALDRRTDVYSLGATLYDLLASRPPFVDPIPWNVILRVAQEDAEPIRKINPAVPQDLAKVVMKCLEKEPQRRYESAKALGDDLQRFLDGEPVHAKHASLPYVLLKKAWKNKLAVSLAGALLVGVSAPSAVWVRGRQEAAEQARLAQSLGEDMKEMELFMRAAYGLPLHDIDRERSMVRERLRDVEATMALAGPAGEGPGHYALGRGYIALQEYELAHEHLTLATQAGYSSREMDLALGRVLGELYKKGIEKAKRIENTEQRETRLRQLDVDYREAALRHLERGRREGGAAAPRERKERVAEFDSPEYAEALVALYSGRTEEARILSRAAFEKNPLLYEAKKLEGDIHFEDGSKTRVDMAFNYELAMKHFLLAEEAYKSASAIGRSDPAIYEAECELGEHALMLTGAVGAAAMNRLDAALEACSNAIAASPSSAVLYTRLAGVRVAWAYDSVSYVQGDPEQDVDQAIAAAEEAVRRGPSDATAIYYLGVGLLARGTYEERVGRDASASLDQAVRAYEKAVELDPTFLWATRELGMAYEAKAKLDMARGESPEESLASSLKYLRRANEIEPRFALAYESIASTYRVMAEHHAAAGQDPTPALESALTAQRTHKALIPNFYSSYEGFAETYLIMARHELDSGRDPRALIERATRSIEEAMERNPKNRWSDVQLARARTLAAEDALGRGADASPMLMEAREAARRAAARSPRFVEPRVALARVELIAARLAMQEGARRAAREHFEAAEEALHGLLGDPRAEDPRAYQEMAELYGLRAKMRIANGEDAAAEIAQGLAIAETALAKNPRMVPVLITQAVLHSMAARAARDPSARREAERRAEESLMAAARTSPLGERRAEAARTELASGGGGSSPRPKAKSDPGKGRIQ
jgi:eukaryotic-like serine/threonine-protein kinase